jgi:hypothetical protein
MADAAPRPTLLQLAADQFQDILPAEEKLFKAAEKGDQADCEEGPGAKGVIRSHLLSWLCTDLNAASRVTYRGVLVCRAEIHGKMDLEWSKISFPLRTRECVFKEALILRNSHLFCLHLIDTSIKSLSAEGLVSDQNIFLSEGFRAEKGVGLSGARIGGNLKCDGGRFFGETGTLALDLSGARIEGSVLLRRDSEGGQDFEAEGGVNLIGVTIDGNLDCNGGQFVSKSETLALNAFVAKIKGFVYLGQGFRAEGGVSLGAATIEGNLFCGGGQFVSKGKAFALDASVAKIKGSLYLGPDFKAEGAVFLGTATIEGDLNCNGGQFASKGDSPALSAPRAKIRGSVLLSQGFIAEGAVSLQAATIEGSLVCEGEGGKLVSQGQEWALDANGATIGDSVLLRKGIAAEGELCFAYANVTRNFQWWCVRSGEKAILNLSFAKVGKLLNDPKSWPNEGNLFLGGFVYDEIDDRPEPPTATIQIQWLHRQPQDTFLSQPYEQLAAVFRERGLEEDARQVMVVKNKEHGRHLHLPIWDWRPWMWFDWVSAVFKWSWYRIFGNPLVGFGYRPGRAFGWSLLVIAIGWVFFQLGDDWKLFSPTGDTAYVVEKEGTRRFKNGRPQISKDYPKFNAFVYSVETFVPLLKLGVGEHWAPNANLGLPLCTGVLVKIGFPSNYGSLLRYYMWLHIILGWILGTLWIGGLTKLLKT